jgi:catalase
MRLASMSEITLEIGKEYPPVGEETEIQAVIDITKKKMLAQKEYQATYPDQHPKGYYPPTRRDQHPKSHGYLTGEFIVEENIADELKVGIFARPRSYPIQIRFSNGSNDPRPDTAGNVRGMAIKIMGVEGAMAIDTPEHQGEQDFVLINDPAFFMKDVIGYLNFFAALDTMNKIKEGTFPLNPDGKPQLEPGMAEKLNQAKAALEIIHTMEAKPVSNLLKITYWSATPYKFGDGAMKFSAVSKNSFAGFDQTDSIDQENYLRDSMARYLAEHDASFDFNVQLQKDADAMPIEDPTKVWDETISPFVKVGTIKIPSQIFDTEDRNQADEKQSFSPWHALEIHRPLGGINRARKMYIELANFRNKT